MQDLLTNPESIRKHLLLALKSKKMEGEIALLESAKLSFSDGGYDNWNGGTQIHDLNISISPEQYHAFVHRIDLIKEVIREALSPLFETYSNDWLGAINILPNSSADNKISEITRREIFDYFSVSQISWHGRLSELDFLNRLYNLERMPSDDHRFKDASGDIWQHRVNNDDWEDDWIFSDHRFDLLHTSDDEFLRFLCEIFHPVVIKNQQQVSATIQDINSILAVDGYELVSRAQLSRRPIFSARLMIDLDPLQTSEVRKTIEQYDSSYLSNQLTRIETAISQDPELAIGTAKEIVESCCKSILAQLGETVDGDPTVNELVRACCKALKLTPDDIPKSAKGADTIKVLLSNLATIAKALAELRNEYGTGHGKDMNRKGLSTRHARLAAGSATTLAVFLMETFEEQRRNS